MAPPPTPAQPRFLPPKTGQHSQTAGQVPLSLHNGPRLYASTPRFNTSGTPRPVSQQQPPPFSTPATPSARPRATQYKPLSDVIDTSPISPHDPQDGDEDPTRLDESVETDSPLASRLPPRHFRTTRPAKRRRVSVSPEIDPSPEDGKQDVLMEDDEQVQVASSPTLDDRIAVESSFDLEGPAANSQPQSPQAPDEQIPRHPTFQNAPRFKTAEIAAEVHQRPLPEAFSPQRRGAKYVAGGLAAEVRDWLVQIKGSSEYDRPAGSSIDMVVDEAMSAPSLHVIAARRLDSGSGDENIATKVILAGDGRVTELRGTSTVKPGSKVSMSQPMWDITLDDIGQIAVACDWETARR
ncbi:hypothetical protein KVR01_001726 [Diaporthe batatas]|uniref:uncharacterized protein n=1 Tax=Diaporthe batatas TaxID=748121 RepID=UPI001D03F19C|nr:uncharacterized protein KVR01_001726 [Diaporthe batatas]KAG8168977.1 hypothetical protein KVR01_001726 [Diaporthe batatas]